jgi:Ca2+-binding EF-hand superfamily protein
MFDTDGKGYISLADLKRVVQDLGDTSITAAELEEMITFAQGDSHTGKVTLEQFVQMMQWTTDPDQ